MELSHSLTLNEEALAQIDETKRPVFIFEWLRFLDKVLIAAQKNDIKGCQKQLVQQLMNHIQESPGPPTRKLIARCLATLFSVGDTFLLFDTVNKCNDILKNKDDSPSFLPTKLAAICCIGTMYKKLGRMMGRSYEETVHILIRCLRNAESQTRIEIMLTLEKVCAGMGTAINNVHKDIYKATRHCLIDRVMAVRCAATNCLLEMLNHAPFLYTTELESLATLCFRAFDGSNYIARCTVAKLLGTLMAMTQQLHQNNGKGQTQKGVKIISLDEALGVFMSGFLRGGVGFLKGTGEIIKGGSGVNREVRVGVTHGYVTFVQILGTKWLEKNMKTFLSHVLYLAANPKAASSHVDAVYSRKCINFILRSVLGKMLGERAQSSACKDIAHIIVKEMNSIDFNPENAKDVNQETLFSQHLLVCALQEIGVLVLSLGTSAHDLITDQSLNLIDVTLSVLIHPCHAARLAAAWCLRCICVAVPSQISPLIDRCVNGIEQFRTSPEAISGYSSALAAVLGGVKLSPLGIPHMKGKIIFNTAEELLRSANQNSRLSLNRTHAGWLLIGAIMTLGIPVVKGLLPRMLLLWRNSFPRSTRELDSEKARGDVFTWQVTLEGRAGALSAMHSFLQNCLELVTEDITRRLLTPIESALAMLASISGILKNYGQHLKAPAAMVRLRLCETLLLLHPQYYENSYTHLLRMLVAEFTLTENPANTTTSQLLTACHAYDSVIFGTWLQETDHRTIEDQLQSNSAAGSGALEHDPCCLYRQVNLGETIPGPLPLGVTVIDISVLLFGQIFPRVTNKHRVQMLDHFTECIKHVRSTRQEAVQMNVFTALLSALKGLTETKVNINQEDIKKSAVNLIIGAIVSPNPLLRYAAADAVGRMAQVVYDPKFTAELAQTSFDRLKSARDVASRTGHSLALGCLHKYIGGMGSSQNLNTSVSILLALAQDQTSPIVQVWALHALAFIVDSGGPMFRGYVEPSLSLLLKLLLNVPQSHIDVHQCIGKVLSALITTVGPELQGNTSSICTARSSFLCACAIMQDHHDPLVQAEATGCLQQLHLFAPKHVNLSSLVPTLCKTLFRGHLLLRKAAISCLRQLVQREAKEVCDHAMNFASDSKENNKVEGFCITETGLPGIFFSMLDTETDPSLIKDIHDTIISMLQVLAADNLSQWLGMCKDVLTVATEATIDDRLNNMNNENEEMYEPDDDQAEFHTEDSSLSAVQPRWPTRVFAAECVRKIISACESNRSAHFDLIKAKELQATNGKSDFLCFHLSDLIRMAFIAATSDSDPLRLEGLKTLQEIIEKFAKAPEPEFPGHLLLEQFQAQVGAALRPAFLPDTSSLVTAAACEVCSTWIGSNVARNLNDLKRVHQLLVSSLTKFRNKNNSSQLYNESLVTLEKLSILKAWAEVYVVAMKGSDMVPNFSLGIKLSTDTENKEFNYEYQGDSLLTLVQPELISLSQYWMMALKDHALLSLPNEFSSQLPHDGGAFYTNETMDLSRPYYASFWPPILHATALWLNSGNFKTSNRDNNERFNNNQNNRDNDNSSDRFHLLFGICMEALCSPRSVEPLESIITCLKALYTVLDTKYTRVLLMSDSSLGIEMCNVLHRLILTRDNHNCQLLCLEILQQVVKAAQENISKKKSASEIDNSIDIFGEGGEMGDLIPGKSLVVSILEVCLCLLIRQLPNLSPSTNSAVINSIKVMSSSEKSDQLIAASIRCMEYLHTVCSPKGALSILPTILYLITGVIKEVATTNNNNVTVLANNTSIQAALHCLKLLAADNYCTHPESAHGWQKLLQSALAKIIDLTKIRNEDSKLDEVTMMLAIAVFVLNAPHKVIVVPNLQYPCINYFRQCLESPNCVIKLKCVRTLKSLFAHENKLISVPYILSLAPYLVEFLYSEAARQPHSDGELLVTIETITVVESLIEFAEPDKRIQMLGLLIPVLVSYLSPEPLIRNKYSQSLNDVSLQWLMKIGPKYPEEFKTMMQSEELRIKLENTIRNSQSQKCISKNDVNQNQQLQNNTPTIKLKTDFSNFS
ncbi:HEAT repeat-containing protein 5B [Diorhabda carinulata]|uniref:HEAT repeat-containing protein 5B n=1 Tax=Diorhabda carinulata TaxID=1163345 RepID=UPI0025A08197|nr:HEAT repeat-containing protein 5B [Diorhabda carinulata]